MFKKKCEECGESISKKYEFCPYCGEQSEDSDNQEHYGLLGTDDSEEVFQEPILGFNSPIINKLLSGAMRMLEKEMRNYIENQGRNSNQLKLTLFS